jgi:hypothetical protein
VAFDSADRATLARIEKLLKQLVGGQTEELKYMATYKEEVERLIGITTAQTGINQSALTMIQGMVEQLRELRDDPNAENVDALADAWEQSMAELAAGIEANQPPPEQPPA